MNLELETIKFYFSRDKRKSERLTLPTNIFHSPPPYSKWIGPLCVEDIGGGGLCFRGRERFKKNTALKFKVELPQETRPIILQGKVSWCKVFSASKFPKNLQSLYTVGVRFCKTSYRNRRRFIKYLSEKILMEYLDSKGKIKTEK